MASPLKQFEIKPLGGEVELAGQPLAFTNSALAMAVSAAAVLGFFLAATARGRIIPDRLQMAAEAIYGFIDGTLRENAGPKAAVFFPFVFTLFVFILFGNLLGLLPGSFTYTSHLAVTFAMAIFVFLMASVVGFAIHGLKFLGFFVPSGVPWALLPLMVPIEIISYLSRPVSLALRLFANMTAGHIMLKVFAGFVFSLGILGVLPIGVNVLLLGFEVLIAFLQAYVFSVLTCLYLKDALEMH